MLNSKLKNIKLLIVDDEKSLLKQAESFLSQEDERLEINTVTSAEKALTILENESFHAIVSDYKMPEMDGLELLKTLRDKGIDIPFILFTGHGREDVAMEALNSGANRYLQKGKDPKSRYRILSDAIIKEVKKWRERKMHEGLFETSSELIAQIDKNGYFLAANSAMCKSIGISREKLVGKSLFDALPEDVAKNRLEIGKEVIEEREIRTFEDKRGNKIFHNIFSPVEITGEEDTFQVFARDITERKKIEEDLKRSEERFKQLFEANPDPVYLVDNDGIFQQVNPSLCELTGYDRNEIIGSKFDEVEFLKGESREKVLQNFRKRREGKEVGPYNIKVSTKSGDTLYVEVNANLLKEDGEIVGILGIARDVTERKLAEQEIRESEKRYRKTIENANIGIVIYGSNRKIKILNQKMRDIIGYDQDELSTLEDWFEKLYPEEEKREKIREKWFELISEKGEVKGGEATVTTREGEKRTLMFNGFKLDSGDVISFAQDITERKKSEEKFRQLFESAPDGALLIDKNGRFMEVSDVFSEKIGYERDELIGKSIAEPLDFLPEESRKKAFENMSKRIEEGEVPPYTIEVLNRDGETLFVEINANPIKIEGELIGEIAIARDITERKRTEERKEFLQTMLRHDLRNKTSTVLGYLDLLEKTGLSEKQEKYVRKALNASESSSELIDKVSTLRKLDEEKKSEVELVPVLKETVSEYEEIAKEKGMDLEYQINDKCEVKAGPLLEEIFSNLIENSIKHSDCSKIRVGVLENESVCKVTIEDSGCGIPEEIREKIFEKGFKRGDEAGSGLGMYLVKRIVEDYGGNIDLEESELGGAKFDIILQKADSY